MAEEKKPRRWWGAFKALGPISQAISALEQLGLKKTVEGLLVAAVIPAIAWAWEHVPLWAVLLILLISTYVALGVIYRLQLMRVMSKFDPSKYQGLGSELVGLSGEIFRFLAERQRDLADAHRALPVKGRVGTAMINRVQEDRDFEAITARLFHEKFDSRVLALLSLLQRLGISVPREMVSHVEHRPSVVPQYLGFMGNLLERGCIKEAIENSQDRTRWQ